MNVMHNYRDWKTEPSNKAERLYSDFHEQYKDFKYEQLIYERGRLERSIDKEDTFTLPVTMSVVSLTIALISLEEKMGYILFTMMFLTILLTVISYLIYLYKNRTDKEELRFRLHIVNEKLDSLR